MLVASQIARLKNACAQTQRRFALTAALACAASTAVAQHPVIDAVERARSAYRLPGVAVSVFTSQGIQSTVFMGVREIGKPDKIGPNDLYNLASCTKPITATLAAVAVDRGDLAWDTTLAEAIPDIAEGTPYAAATLRQLLSHHAGIAPLTDNETPLFKACVLDAPDDPKEARRHLTKTLLSQQPSSAPGAEFAYSNGGYAIAAVMIEDAMGGDYEGLLKREIFDKAGMGSAIIGWPATPERPDQPRGHRVVDGERVPEALGEADDDEALSPAGGVSCSIEDFARFGMMHLKGLAGREGLASPEAIATLHTETGQSDAAMGWFIRDVHGETIHYHDGGTGRFSVAIMLLPRHDLGVVVATNTGGGKGAGGEACQTLCLELMRLALQRKSNAR